MTDPNPAGPDQGAEFRPDERTSAEEPIYPPTRYTAPPGANRVILVRHGTPVPYRPLGDRSAWEGQDDPPLSAAGHEQAVWVARYLVNRKVAAVYSSPLQRALETAKPLVDMLGVSPLVLEDLREVHLGQWERGVVHQRLTEGDPVWAEVWRLERWDAIPGAEDNESLRGRVRSAINHISQSHRDQTVAVFSHDGVIAAALSLATGSRPFAFASSGHASTSELVVEGPDRWRLRSFNGNAHLRIGSAAPR